MTGMKCNNCGQPFRRGNIEEIRQHKARCTVRFGAYGPGRRKYPDEHVRRIHELRAEQQTTYAIANTLGMSQSFVWDVIAGRRRARAK